jgi:RNA polymerase sigma-70 factor (ECF subfamily)
MDPTTHRPEPEPPLLARHCAGDETAFPQLVHLHHAALIRLAAQLLGNHSDAEDAVQVALLQVLRHASSFQTGAPLRPWLAGITINACRQFRRREGRLAALHRRAAQLFRPMPIQELEDDAGLEAALERLPPEERALLWLRFGDGMTAQHVAQVLGVPQKTAESRVRRALQRLQRAIPPRRRGAMGAIAALVTASYAKAAAHEGSKNPSRATSLAHRLVIQAADCGAEVNSPIAKLPALCSTTPQPSRFMTRWLSATVGVTAAFGLLWCGLTASSASLQVDDHATPAMPAHLLGLDGLIQETPRFSGTDADDRQFVLKARIIAIPSHSLAELEREAGEQPVLDRAAFARVERFLASHQHSVRIAPTLTLGTGQTGKVETINQYAYIRDYQRVAGEVDPIIHVLKHGDHISVTGEVVGDAVRLVVLRFATATPLAFPVHSVLLHRQTRGGGIIDSTCPIEEPELLAGAADLREPVILTPDAALLMVAERHRQRGEATMARRMTIAPVVVDSTNRTTEHTEDETLALIVTAEVAPTIPPPTDLDLEPAVAPAISRR